LDLNPKHHIIKKNSFSFNNAPARKFWQINVFTLFLVPHELFYWRVYLLIIQSNGFENLKQAD
jgi:hypothetical protein